jgi:hypothetical protein
MRAFADQQPQTGVLGWMRSRVSCLRGNVAPHLKASSVDEPLLLVADDSASDVLVLSPSRQAWTPKQQSPDVGQGSGSIVNSEAIVRPVSALDAETLLSKREQERFRENAYGEISLGPHWSSVGVDAS